MNKKFAALFTLGALSCALLATPAGAAPPNINASDPQHFQWNGVPWYPTGYTPGLNAIIGRNSFDVDPGGTYYKAILRDMANSNVKLTRQVFHYGQPDYEAPAGNCSVGSITRVPLTYYQRTGPGTASDGGLKYDLTKFNQSYINHFKNFVAEAAARNVVVIVDIFDSWHTNNEVSSTNCVGPRGRKFDAYYGDTGTGVLNNINGVNGKTKPDFHPSTTSTSPTSVYFHQRALVRKVVQELGTYDNVIWSVSNEVEHDFPTGSASFTAWKNHMVAEIKAAEVAFAKPTHLIMQSDLPDHIHAGGNDNYIALPLPVGESLVRDLFDARQTWNMPLIADNDGGTPPMDGADGKRRKAWASLTSGGHMTWFGHLMPDIAVWNDPKHVAGRKYFGYVTKFVDGLAINLDGMLRQDHLIKKAGTATQSGWLYTRLADEYIAYMDAAPVPAGCTAPSRSNPADEKCFPEGSTLGSAGLWPGVTSYTISSLPASFTATWYNPRTGVCQPPFAGTGPTATFNLPAPNNTDWALHIKAGSTPFGVSAPIPGSQTAKAGSTVEFGVCARGVAAVSYAWQFKANGSGSFVTLTNGGAYAGVNTPTLTISNAQAAQAGTYRCLVNAANSGPAVLTVIP